MKDVEEVFSKADFTAGSDHKEKLREKLFAMDSEKERMLDDDELDLAAAGKKIHVHIMNILD